TISRKAIGYHAHLPARFVRKRAGIANRSNLCGGKSLVPFAERAGFVGALRRRGDKLVRPRGSIFGDNYPAIDNWVTAQFRHASASLSGQLASGLSNSLIIKLDVLFGTMGPRPILLHAGL